MEKGLNVLSLFDGCSGGRQALERAGIKVDNYFASEIDKYAIKVTMANYPDTIQLGSVVDVDGYSLPKIDMLIGGSPCQSFSFAGKRKGMSTKCETEILTLEQYLEMKSEGFEFEGQSYLFWEYMRLLNEVKPKYFLLENVIMGEKWEKILSKAIGVNSIEINSSLLSAQNRKRLYWTNIGMQPRGFFGDLESVIKQPKDKLILLKDILEDEIHEKYFLSEKMINGFSERNINHNEKGNGFKFNPTTGYKKGNAITNPGKNRTDDNYIVHNLQKRSADRPAIQKNKNAGGSGHLSREDGKTYCLDMGNTQAVEIKRRIIVHDIPEIVNVRKFEVNILSLQKTLKEHKKLNNQQIADALEVPKTNVEHWFRTDTYFSIPDKDIWLKLKELLEIKTDEFDESIITFEEKEGVFEKGNRVYDENGIFPTLTTMSENDRILVTSGTLRTHKDGEGFREVKSGKGATIPARAREDGSGQNIVSINSRIRRLTPIECERLQTVKDNYTNHVSDSQRYKMLGNGWTVDVIAYIFSYIDK
jgi:DNA-cytosine methyltransferase